MGALFLIILLLSFTTFLVAQTAHSQTVHDEWVIPFENTWVYCLDENASRVLVYDVKHKYDRHGDLIWFSLLNKGSFINGEETGSTYKLIDSFRERYGLPPNQEEIKINGPYKIISLGDGKVYGVRVQVLLVVDKCCEVIEKELVRDLCFSW